MDFQKFLEYYECKACIMSVETYPDGTYGNIRVERMIFGLVLRVLKIEFLPNLGKGKKWRNS